MKDESIRQQFIALRAEGLSYDRIAQTLDVSKPTLIAWSRLYHLEIQNLQAIVREKLQTQFLGHMADRLQQLSDLRLRLKEEFAKRELTALPADRLLRMIQTIEAQMERLLGETRFSENVRSIPHEEMVEETLDWRG